MVTEVRFRGVLHREGPPNNGQTTPLIAPSTPVNPAAPLNLSNVNVVRGLERRLESLMEGIAGRVFSGRLHPSEIAGKLAREADLARFEHEAGPATANQFTILVNPKNLTMDPAELEAALEREMNDYTTEEGLRLEGPVKVLIQASEDIAPGSTACHVEVSPGPPVAWADLVATDQTFHVGRNRTIIGRGDTCRCRRRI